MSLRDCIDAAYQQGQITLEEAQALKRRYDNLARRILDPTKVKGALMAELQAEAQEKQRRALLTETARKRLVEDLEAYKAAHGDMASGLKYIVEHYGEARFADIENHRKAIIGEAHAKLAHALGELRRGWLTGHLRRRIGETKVRMDNVVRERFREKSGDALAAEFAAAFGVVLEDLRVRFNEAGGGIPRLETYGMPQSHDPVALMNVGEDNWVERLMRPGVLARDRMLHPLTGRVLSDDELRDSLRVAFQRITTDGWIDREPSGTPHGRGALWSQHADHRFIHFASADEWLAYNREFGGRADPFDALMGHISMMARDIAAMEVLGPNPEVMLEYLGQMAMRDAMLTADRTAIDRARTEIRRAETMWQRYRGTTQTPENQRMANILAGAREFVTAASLGAASLSALSDVVFSAVARAYVGMTRSRASTFRVIYDVIAQTAERRELAVRSGLILDEALHGLHTQARYVGTINTRSITGFLADRTVALSGLSAWTQRIKHSFGLEVQGLFADMAQTPWDDLPELVRRTLARHGLTPQDWDTIRAAPLYEPSPGARFLRPNEIKDVAGRDLAEKYLRMILREMRFAAPEATIRSTSLILGDSRPGTIGGEFLRSALQFKSFPIAVLMLHGARVARDLAEGRHWTAAQYAGTLLVIAPMYGAVAMALKDLSSGKDVRKWKDEDTYKTAEFWGAALLQSGGLGIWGDFLFADLNRFGGGPLTTLAGPLAGRLDQLRNLGPGNVKELLAGDTDTNAGRELVRALKQNTPLIGSLWYARLAYERVVLDQLQRMLDPDASAAFARRMQKERRDYQRDYWWRPGSLEPRMPELNVMRE